MQYITDDHDRNAYLELESVRDNTVGAYLYVILRALVAYDGSEVTQLVFGLPRNDR